MGNTIVMKLPQRTPLSGLHMASLIQEAEFPEGVVNVVVGYRTKAGRALVTHKGINRMTPISISRKPEETSHISEKLDDAVEQAHYGMFFNKGRRYSAGSQTFVQSKIDGQQVEEILRHVESGKRDGAHLVTGKKSGTKWGDRGHYVLPAVFAKVDHHMAIAKEEVIGPVKKLIRFDSMEDLLKKSSTSQNHPPAAVITKDADKAKHIAQNTVPGSIWVNTDCRSSAGSIMGTHKYLGQRHSPAAATDESAADSIGFSDSSLLRRSTL
ncbi:hypothetical protein COOONC_15948 [Cooperia oncophora]